MSSTKSPASASPCDRYRLPWALRKNKMLLHLPRSILSRPAELYSSGTRASRPFSARACLVLGPMATMLLPASLVWRPGIFRAIFTPLALVKATHSTSSIRFNRSAGSGLSSRAMVGAATGEKPYSSARAADSACWWAGRSMAMRFLPSFSDRRTTSPTTSMAGDSIRLALAFSAMLPRVAVISLCSFQPPFSTMAAGVSAGFPAAIRAAAFCSSRETPMSTTRVPSRPAMAFQSSGDSFPGSSWPVTMVRDEATPRWVTGIPARAGAAMEEVTPGTTSKNMPLSCNARPSSPPRPKR